MTAARTILSLLIAVLSMGTVGCIGPWKSVEAVTPWAAPGTLARPVAREVKQPFFIIAAPDSTMDMRWTDTHGTKVVPRHVVEKAQAYLDDSGASRAWLLTDEFSRDLPKRLAPFDFTIVSIDPTVVLMTPREIDLVTGRFKEMTETQSSKYVYGRRLTNVFSYGTRLPYNDVLLWFSPELKQGPSEAQADDSGSRIVPLRRGRLIVRRDSDEWVVTRE